MNESEPRWGISLTRQAEKTLHRLSKKLLQRLDQAILALATNPRPPKAQQLPGHDNLYRLYVDEWRIAYAVEEERLSLLILEIAPKQQPERYRFEELDGTGLSEKTKDRDQAENEVFTKIDLPNFLSQLLETNLHDEQTFKLIVDFARHARQEKIRLLIVDDLPETCENLRKLLYFEHDIEVVGAATNGEDAIQMAIEQRPDIVLMDIILPGMDGITATEIISQQVPSAQIIMMSVQGDADTLRRAMLTGAREFLIKPFSSDELMSSIRRVYQLRPTMGEKQAIQPRSEAEVDLDQSQIRATALWFKFYKLGNSVEISLSVADLSESLSFYQKLGLERVDGGEKPYPWAVVSDGRLYLGLHQQMFPSPTLSYFAIWALSERMVHLQKLGVMLDNIQKFHRIVIMPQNFATAEFESPEGQRVLLADLASDVETTPTDRKFFSKYEVFGELSLNTKDVKMATAYWEKLGFGCVAEGNQPYPWAIVSDGRIRLGFHQNPKLTQPPFSPI